MKTLHKQFIKFWLLEHIPLYGFILWLLLKLGVPFWLAWLIANQLYASIVFPLMKFGIFQKENK